jgi:hypothetical protein
MKHYFGDNKSAIDRQLNSADEREKSYADPFKADKHSINSVITAPASGRSCLVAFVNGEIVTC